MQSGPSASREERQPRVDASRRTPLCYQLSYQSRSNRWLCGVGWPIECVPWDCSLCSWAAVS
jgi:hypothetical protein